MWTMEHLNRYINDKFRKTKGLPRDWVFTTFTVSRALSRVLCAYCLWVGLGAWLLWIPEACVVLLKPCLMSPGVIFYIKSKGQK